MENTSDSFMPRPLLFCLKSGRSVCYSVPDNNVRMEKAAKMAVETTMSVHDICIRVGFRNLSYFCKRFREQYGYTPESYRKNILNSQKTKQ